MDQEIETEKIGSELTPIGAQGLLFTPNLMETILVFARTGNDGSLAKSAREALHAAATLHKSLAGSKLVVGFIGENVQAAANSIAACPATKYLASAARILTSPATPRTRRRQKRLQSRAGRGCHRLGDFALGTCAARRRAASRRSRGHARHWRGGGGRKNIRQPLVLSPADGSARAGQEISAALFPAAAENQLAVLGSRRCCLAQFTVQIGQNLVQQQAQAVLRQRPHTCMRMSHFGAFGEFFLGCPAPPGKCQGCIDYISIGICCLDDCAFNVEFVDGAIRALHRIGVKPALRSHLRDQQQYCSTMVRVFREAGRARII